MFHDEPSGSWKKEKQGKFKKKRSDFGGRSRRDSWKSDDRGFDRPRLFTATCAECFASCEVPFRPNGRKPVLCTSCFRGEDGGRAHREPRPQSSNTDAQSEVVAELKKLNRKFDQLIEALQEASGE